MIYELPKLSYEYNALEPFIDAKTMEIHHTKHHQAYVTNLNAVLEKYPQIADGKLEDLLQKLDFLKMDEKDKKILRNHGGGHLNHSFFWNIMGPNKEIDEKLVEDIKNVWGSIDEFKKLFTEIATKLFGSGWAWLVKDKSGLLKIYSLPNQDSPFLTGDIPLIGLDVWEHAY